MSVTSAAARTVIREANLANKQVVAHLYDGTRLAGTARWFIPGEAKAGRATDLVLCDFTRLPWSDTRQPGQQTVIPLTSIDAIRPASDRDSDFPPEHQTAVSDLGLRNGRPDPTWLLGSGTE